MTIFSRLLIALILLVGSPAYGQKLMPEEVISKHLLSIGTEANRQGLKTLFVIGTSEFEAKVPVIKGGGKAIIVSDPDNLYFVMSFNSREYPFEKIGVFRDDINLPNTVSGSRSLLGAFLAEHSKILLENLFAGSMSLRWINHISESKKLKLRYAGTKKVNGREAYVLDVMISGVGSDDFKVKLYFDKSTFHHMRSEYRREIEVGRIEFGRQNQQAAARVELIEEFSDHRDAGGLTLPHVYRVTFTSNSNTQIYENTWGVRVADYYFNQKLAPDFFKFDAK